MNHVTESNEQLTNHTQISTLDPSQLTIRKSINIGIAKDDGGIDARNIV